MPKSNPLPPPKKGGKPRRITTPGKPGDSGPGGAHPGRNRPKKKAKTELERRLQARRDSQIVGN